MIPYIIISILYIILSILAALSNSEELSNKDTPLWARMAALLIIMIFSPIIAVANAIQQLLDILIPPGPDGLG